MRDMLMRLYTSAAVEAAISHAATYPSEAASYSTGYAEFLELGRRTPSTDYAAVAIWRREFRGRLAQLFKSVDMLIAPTMPVEPPTLEMFAAVTNAPPEAVVGLMLFTIPFNAAGLPSLVLPLAKSDQGVPLGFQLIGPDLGEARLFAAGAGYERIAGYAGDHPAM